MQTGLRFFYRLVFAFLILHSAFLFAQTPYYHIDRSFVPIEFTIEGDATEYTLYSTATQLTSIVKGTNININTNESYAIEKQAIAVGFDSAGDAWSAATNYNGTSSNHTGKAYNNVGWVRNIVSINGAWGAYIWTLQNRIAFQSSTSSWWINEDSIPVAISNVMVGTLGNYGPISNVVDIGPVLDPAFVYPQGGQSNEAIYQVDYTNVYYELVIPDIWINPIEACACVGDTNPVQFTVYGTNIPQGVTWTLNPSGMGAEIYPSNDWHFASVMPGSVATNYKVRATSIDNTNFYDEVDLMVVGMEALQYKIGTNSWTNMPDTLYVCKDTTVDFKAIKVPTNAAWPDDKPAWGGVVSGSGVDSNSYSFNTISASTSDYKIVSAECGNTVTGKVIVLNVEYHSLLAAPFYGDTATRFEDNVASAPVYMEGLVDVTPTNYNSIIELRMAHNVKTLRHWADTTNQMYEVTTGNDYVLHPINQAVNLRLF